MNYGNREVYDVIISGLGPTGLTLAHALGRRSLRVLVLEREPAFYGNARAVYTDGECMRIYQNLGMADRLAADMLQDATVQMLLPDGRVLLQLKSTRRDHGWPLSNFFYQPFLETALADALEAYPDVHVMRGNELLRFEQDNDGVNVWFAATEGSGYSQTSPTMPQTDTGIRVRGKFLVACDGGRSTVRTQLGITMTGKNFPNPWLVTDVKLKDDRDGLHHLPNFSFVCDPQLPTVLCVQPRGHQRFEFMLMPGQTKEYLEDPATVRQLMSRWVDPDKFEVLRTLVYTFNALMADRWRDGRVFLAGDAAHMTPQFIGQGMNAGVRDAFNLSWKLEAVLRGRAGEALLDTYETERKPHAGAMIREAIRMKSYVSMVNPIATSLRNALTRLVQRLPGVGPYITQADFIPKPTYDSGSYFGLRRRSRNGAEGRMLPQPPVRGKDGQRHRLDDLLGDGFALIGAGIDPRMDLTADELAFWNGLDARFVALYPLGERPQMNVDQREPEGLIELEDIEGTLLKWIRKRGRGHGSITVVRPDRFVVAQVASRDLRAATRQLRDQLGISATATRSVPVAALNP